MDYSFFNRAEKAQNTAQEKTQAVEQFNKKLARAKRRIVADDEPAEEKQARAENYENYMNWLDNIAPESSLNDAPVGVYDYMQQDDEEGFGSASYLSRRTAGTIASIKDKLGTVFSFMEDEPDLRTFMLRHPKFEDAGPTAVTALGKAIGHIRSLEMTLRSRGLVGHASAVAPTNIIESGWDYIKTQVGERGLDRVPMGDRSKILGAVWAQEIIKNSSLKDKQAAMDYIVPKVRSEIEGEFALPYKFGDGVFHQDMKKLMGVADELDGVDENATFNEAITDEDRNRVARRWYATITGDSPTDDASVNSVMRVLKPYLNIYDRAVKNSEMAYKWHLVGVDLPLRRLHNDGSLFSLAELPGAAEATAKLARNVNDNVAYQNINDHARLYGGRKIKEKLNNTIAYLRDELGMSGADIARLKKKRLNIIGVGPANFLPDDRLLGAKDNNDRYYRLQRLALADEGLRSALSAKKNEYAEEWRKYNEKKVGERALEDGLDPEVVGKFIKTNFERSAEVSETAAKRQEAYDTSYLYRYGNDLIHAIGNVVQSLGGEEFGEAMSGIHRYLYASAHDGIPTLDKEVLGIRDRSLTDVVRDRLAQLPFFPENPNEALNNYLDRVVEGRNIPILDQMGMVTIDALHGLMELPLMSLENPWATGVMFGTLKKYNAKSVGVAQRVAKKLGRPGLEAPLLAVLRPHEFAANTAKASKLLLSDHMLFGCSMNKFRKTLNNMSPELREKYHTAMVGLTEDMIERGGRDVQQLGLSIRSAVDELGMKMAEAEYENKLTRADIANVRQKALDRDVSFEAANAIFATPFGNGKLVDGALAKHITDGAVASLLKYQTDIIDGIRKEDRTGRSPAELMYNLNREYMKFKADKSDEAWTRREFWLREKLGITAPEVFNNVREYFRNRYNHEKSGIFDRDAIEMAVEENQYQVERTAARQRLYRGFQLSLEHKILQTQERIAAHATMKKTKEIRAEEKRLRRQLAEMQRMHTIAGRDVKVLKNLEKSHIVDSTNANEAMFRELENGWKTNGDDLYKKEFRNFLTSTALFNKNSRRLLAKIFHNDEKFLQKLNKAAQRVRNKKKPSFRKQRAAVAKVLKAHEQKSEATGEVTGLYADNPPFKRAEVIRTAKRNMRQLMDYAVKSRNIRSEIAGGLLRPVGDVVNAILTANPDRETSGRLRHIVQRIENHAQGIMGVLDRVRDKVRLLSEDDLERLTELSKLPGKLLDKTQASEVQRIALDMRLVRNQLIRGQYNAGLITRAEMTKAIQAGTDSHFYLDNEMRGDLIRYTSKNRMTLFPESAEIPKHDRLNVQRKFNVPRVTWFDRAAGRWKIKDFRPMGEEDSPAGAIKRAKNFQKSLLKKYPGMNKNDVDYISPMGEEDVAFKGVITRDANYQIDAMRDMIHDLAKTHLMNEIGMMQGLVRTDLPENVRERGGWMKVGGEDTKLTPNQRRRERMQWGSLYGKYVHVSFFDHISAYDDATSVIRGIADSFRDTINEAKDIKGGRGVLSQISNLIESKTGELQRYPMLQSITRKAARHVRRALITTNPASYVNNFMGALIFSHMAGAKVMTPEFWKGAISGDSWSNFGRLLDEVGTKEFEQLGSLLGDEGYKNRGLSNQELRTVKLFKYAVDRGLIERTDEGVFTGGRRRTGKRVKFRELVRDIEETSSKRYRAEERNIRDLTESIQKIDQVLAEGRIPDERIPAFNERRAAFKAMLKDAKRRIGRIGIDHQLRVTTSLPDKILAAASNTRTELGRFINTDPESAVHRIISGWYGNIDPKLKWQTFRYLVEDAGMTREGALQRVLDFHQNYGTVSPFIRNLRKMPFAGSFVPSFPAEAARILKNGFADNIGRTLSPLLATAMWNQVALASQGQTVSDLANLNGDNEDTFGLARSLLTEVYIPLGDGDVAVMDTGKFTPFSPFFQAEGLSKSFVENVQRAGPAGVAVTPLLNYLSNFAFNTPSMQITQKYLAGADPFTGRVTMEDGVTKPLLNLVKDAAGLFIPRAISRPIEQFNRVRETPLSPITQRNVSAVEGLLNTVGINVRALSKDENVANLALRFMYKKEREAFIKNYISLDKDVRNDIYELSNLEVHSTEWVDKLKEIRDDLMDQKPDELRIGGEVIKLKKYPATVQKKIVDRVIAKASNNIYNVVEEMSPIRRLHFLRAVKQTWDREEPVYKHGITTFTSKRYLNRISDLGELGDLFTEAMEMSEKSTDTGFQNDMRTVATALAWRARQLLSNNRNRTRRLAQSLIRSTKGDYKKRLMTLFATQAGLQGTP